MPMGRIIEVRPRLAPRATRTLQLDLLRPPLSIRAGGSELKRVGLRRSPSAVGTLIEGVDLASGPRAPGSTLPMRGTGRAAPRRGFGWAGGHKQNLAGNAEGELHAVREHDRSTPPLGRTTSADHRQISVAGQPCPITESTRQLERTSSGVTAQEEPALLTPRIVQLDYCCGRHDHRDQSFQCGVRGAQRPAEHSGGRAGTTKVTPATPKASCVQLGSTTDRQRLTVERGAPTAARSR
jgi:hypothetical protein